MYPIECPICMRRGFVLVRRDGYEYKYACRCRHGEPHRYDGTACTKLPSKYRCPSVDELPPGMAEDIVKDNCKRYGLRKAGDRYMVDDSAKVTPEQISEIKAMAMQMMGVRL